MACRPAASAAIADVVAEPNLPESNDLVAGLCRDCPQIRYSEPPSVTFNRWSFLGRELRRGVDYLRYLGPAYANAPKLRVRAQRNVPEFVQAALRKPLIASAWGRSLLARVLRFCDRAVPRNPEIDAFIEAHAPDLVLVTPPAAISGGDREMLGFETLTLCPIDRRLIEPGLLSPAEIAWIDAYHAAIPPAVGRLLDDSERAWLAGMTAPLAD